MKTILDFKLGETYIQDGKKYKVTGICGSPSVIFEDEEGGEITIGQGGSTLQEMKKQEQKDE